MAIPEWLQITGILTGILATLITIGGFLRSKYNPLKARASNTIDSVRETESNGSIERDGKRWEYTLKTYDGDLKEVNIQEPPNCADCEETLSRTQNNLIGLNKRITVWECPDCDSYYDYEDDEVRVLRDEIRTNHSTPS